MLCGVRSHHSLKQSTPEAIGLLDKRIERLQDRLIIGGPGPEPDEMQSAIATAQRKHRVRIAIEPRLLSSALP